MKAPLLTVAAIIALTGALVSCGDSEEVAPDVTPAASPAAPTIPATPTLPSGLPTPAAGYTWFETPVEWTTAAPFRVQVPSTWVRTIDANFVPEGTRTNFPYSQIPQIMLFVSEADAVTQQDQRPFVSTVGRQGGGGCSGDVSHSRASPSSTVSSGLYVWNLYSFTCSEHNPNYPPGVSYQGRAGEVQIGAVIVSIVGIEPMESTSVQDAFDHALATFQLR